MHGKLEVHMDGEEVVEAVGEDRGEGVEQTILVEVADGLAKAA